VAVVDHATALEEGASRTGRYEASVVDLFALTVLHPLALWLQQPQLQPLLQQPLLLQQLQQRLRLL